MGEFALSFQFDDGSSDADPIAFEQFFTRAANIGSEERLMLAVLQDAVESFQRHAWSECPGENNSSRKDGFGQGIRIGFSRLRISAKP